MAKKQKTEGNKVESERVVSGKKNSTETNSSKIRDEKISSVTESSKKNLKEAKSKGKGEIQSSNASSDNKTKTEEGSTPASKPPAYGGIISDRVLSSSEKKQSSRSTKNSKAEANELPNGIIADRVLSESKKKKNLQKLNKEEAVQLLTEEVLEKQSALKNAKESPISDRVISDKNATTKRTTSKKPFSSELNVQMGGIKEALKNAKEKILKKKEEGKNKSKITKFINYFI